ncbi:MAG: hypothetical protein IKQ45_01605 [Clostridia bacterium]|nr:hypothetical protein [Clostridia bacterium]
MTEDLNRPDTEQTELLKRMRAIASDLWRASPDVSAEPKPQPEKPARVVVRQPEIGIHNLWMTADETIDWTDALGHEYPTDGLTNQRLWNFYHKQAKAVLSGDPKAYAEVLRKANPLGELTGFAEGISMRAPDSDRVEAEFHCKAEYLDAEGKKYLSAMGIRIARDLFACLPVGEVGVAASRNGIPVMQVSYRREQLMHRNFSFLDPVKLTEECGAVFSI